MCAGGLRVRADPRVLGSGEFVDRLVSDAEDRIRAQVPLDGRLGQAQRTIAKRCADGGVSVAEVQGGSRRGPVAPVRSALAQHLVTTLGLSLAGAARYLGVTTSASSRTFQRGSGARGKSTRSKTPPIAESV